MKHILPSKEDKKLGRFVTDKPKSLSAYLVAYSCSLQILSNLTRADLRSGCQSLVNNQWGARGKEREIKTLKGSFSDGSLQ